MASDHQRPVDPDIDLQVAADRRQSASRQGPILAVLAAGGAAGACARYAAGQWLPAAAGAFPWATFAVNISGCLLIGVLMVVVTEVRSPHPLWRPFLGTGFLGGYTTFSAYAVDARDLLAHGHAATALAYLGGTLAAALAAAGAGAAVTRRIAGGAR